MRQRSRGGDRVSMSNYLRKSSKTCLTKVVKMGNIYYSVNEIGNGVLLRKSRQNQTSEDNKGKFGFFICIQAERKVEDNMTIEKVITNNVVTAIDESNQEVVLMI